MAKGGRKHKLLIYKLMINRWWPATLTLAIITLGWAGGSWATDYFFGDQNPIPKLEELPFYLLIGAGVMNLFFTFLLISVRDSAHVQLFPGYLRLVTPFFRFNVSFKRIIRISNSEVAALFPTKKISSWRAEIIEPLAAHTATVIHLKSYPISRFWLKTFLSPFFFSDNTPHLVLILDDWMRFNAEFDSVRVSAGQANANKQGQKHAQAAGQVNPSGLLADINRAYRTQNKGDNKKRR